MRGRWSAVLQLAISVALLTWLARSIDLREAGAAVRRTSPVAVALATAMSLAAYAGRAARWRALLARAGLELTPRSAYALTLVGTGYGLATPGRVGEFARLLHLDAARSRTLPSVIWDRIGDVLLLEALALPAFLFVPAWRGPLLLLYLAMVVLTVVGVALLDHPAASQALGRIVPPLARPLGRWREHSGGTLASGAFARGLGGGLFFYAFSFGAAYVLVHALAPAADPRLALSFPLIPLLGNLPIAFSGLGLREHVTAQLFAGAGSGAATGTVFSLTWFVTTTLVPGLIGLALAPTRWGRGEFVNAGATPR